MTDRTLQTPDTELVLSVVMPVRDDAPSVNVMTRILSVMIEVPCEIIVVYDDPDDTTIPVVKSLAAKYPVLKGVLNSRGRGVLNAVTTGIDVARGKCVLIYAADEIGPVLAIESMLRLMQKGCDLVSATRYAAGGKRYGGSFVGHVLSYAANRLFGLFTATALSDSTTGMKMFRRELFHRLKLSHQGSGWSFAFAMAIEAQLLDLRLGEVSVVSIDRLFGGQSTFRPLPWILSYSRWFVYGMRRLPPWRRPRPKLAFPTLSSTRSLSFAPLHPDLVTRKDAV
jgi:dolichol-phosphate mannosyltransferase